MTDSATTTRPSATPELPENSQSHLSRLARKAFWVGTLGTVLLALSSWSAGATRTRGGIVRSLGLDWITYGHGAGIGFTLSWIALALLIYAWCVWGRAVRLREVTLRQSVRILTWWSVPMLFAAPLYSRDVYSYLMQGAMVRAGFDPYTDGAAVNPGPKLLEVSPDWRNTTTPYGPLHLWIGDAITAVVGSNITLGVFCYKVISLVGYALIAWAAIAIARRIGGSPVEALWLGVANPLVFLHLVGGMHNESTMVALCCLGLVCALNNRPFIGAALVGLGFSLKATALITLPFLVWIAVRQHGVESVILFPPKKRSPGTAIRRAVGWFLGYGLGSLAIVFAVLTAITWLSGSSWGWVSELAGNTKVINLLALPSFLAQFTAAPIAAHVPGATFNSVLDIYRIGSMVIMVVLLIVVWWRYRQTPARAIEGTAVAYLVTCIFNAVTLPWYYAAGLVLVGTYRPSRRVKQFTIIASLVVAASFTGSGNNWLYRWSWMWFVIAVVFFLYFAVYEDGDAAEAAPSEKEPDQNQNPTKTRSQSKPGPIEG